MYHVGHLPQQDLQSEDTGLQVDGGAARARDLTGKKKKNSHLFIYFFTFKP